MAASRFKPGPVSRSSSWQGPCPATEPSNGACQRCGMRRGTGVIPGMTRTHCWATRRGEYKGQDESAAGRRPGFRGHRRTSRSDRTGSGGPSKILGGGWAARGGQDRGVPCGVRLTVRGTSLPVTLAGDGPGAVPKAPGPMRTPSPTTRCSPSASRGAGSTCRRTRPARGGCRPGWAARARRTQAWLAASDDPGARETGGFGSVRVSVQKAKWAFPASTDTLTLRDAGFSCSILLKVGWTPVSR